MNVVGRVGSLISQGVYSVATPFHPFGGAVDIIVVEQPDGTYRSTPWYVRFGKFQGVLKGAEKVVIAVNGIEANFHMYLDNSGEAYFMREVAEGGKVEDSGNQNVGESSSVEALQGDKEEYEESKIIANEYEFQEERDSVESSIPSAEYSSYRYESLEEDLVKSSDDVNSEMVLVSVDGHILTAPISANEQSLDNVQLTTPQFHLGPGEGSGEAFVASDGTWEFGEMDLPITDDTDSSRDSGRVSNSDYRVHTTETTIISSSSQDVGMTKVDTFKSCLDLMNHADEEALPISKKNTNNESVHSLNVLASSDVVEKRTGDIDVISVDRVVLSNSDVSCNGVLQSSVTSVFQSNLCLHHEQNDDHRRSDVSSEISNQSYADASPLHCEESSSMQTLKDDSMHSVATFSSSDIMMGGPAGVNNIVSVDQVVLPSSDVSRSGELQPVSGELESSVGLAVGQTDTNKDLSSANSNMSCDDQASVVDPEFEKSEKINIGSIANQAYGYSSVPLHSTSLGRNESDVLDKSAATDRHGNKYEGAFSGLGFEISLCGNQLRPGMGRSSAEEAFKAHLVSEDEFKASGTTILKNENLIVKFEDKYFSWENIAHVVLGMAVYGSNISFELKGAIPLEHDKVTKAKEDADGVSPSSSRRWRLFPIAFRTKSLQHTNSSASNEDLLVDAESGLSNPSISPAPSDNTIKAPCKQFVRTKIPTNEQIASLSLKDGQNQITFSFSTRVLGKQQVDAHIYLWKWNARIVISDVDGTITKSDVLGQFMPLVGRDWTQSGVARLFSAIKENGYQLLFLSARAIVQAYLTRSFLLNLKQDGNALPKGPVVISPDGLFPSLYREVIRRAPHEFKIACLEDIKALFPSDYNPFYAGFGNRDTDELSYRKIGIPKGKIFIINPKGEVAINHSIDVKSYTSLHTLVNDMFPPTSMVEQEDFNSWNYWKMPLPSID